MEQLQKDVCKGREFENDSYMKMFTEKMGTYFLYKAILSQSIKNTIQFLKNLIFIYIFRILLQGHKIRRHAILYFFFFFFLLVTCFQERSFLPRRDLILGTWDWHSRSLYFTSCSCGLFYENKDSQVENHSFMIFMVLKLKT